MATKFPDRAIQLHAKSKIDSGHVKLCSFCVKYFNNLSDSQDGFRMTSHSISYDELGKIAEAEACKFCTDVWRTYQRHKRNNDHQTDTVNVIYTSQYKEHYGHNVVTLSLHIEGSVGIEKGFFFTPLKGTTTQLGPMRGH